MVGSLGPFQKNARQLLGVFLCLPGRLLLEGPVHLSAQDINGVVIFASDIARC